MATKPVIVLVHGALTDACIWSGVIRLLQQDGYTVVAPAIPLRGLLSDVEYLCDFLETVKEPFVLVGHSYGGSIISHPRLKTPGLYSLAFVSAFLLDNGESSGELNSRWPGSKLGENTILTRLYAGGTDLYLKPESFAEVYAHDLHQHQVQVLASAQRPINVDALGESFIGSPTWKTTKTWVLVSTEDASIPVEAQRAMAQRADAHITEVQASHASPLSQPAAVATMIRQAATGA